MARWWRGNTPLYCHREFCSCLVLVIIVILLYWKGKTALLAFNVGKGFWTLDHLELSSSGAVGISCCLCLKMDFVINKTWNGKPVSTPPVQIHLDPEHQSKVKLTVKSPFFNDPPNPGGVPGQPFPQLWDYEVVEAFFLADDDRYLEVELSPHGQHLLLMLKGRRNMIKDQLPLEYTSALTSSGTMWTGEAYIPVSYFPPHVTKFNAYAIHGSGNQRVYEALYPATDPNLSDPDFHRLEYFQSIDFKSLVSDNWTSAYSSTLWT